MKEPRTHCKNGHEFTPENTVVCKSGPRKGRRACLICRRNAGKRFYDSHPELMREKQKSRRRERKKINRAELNARFESSLNATLPEKWQPRIEKEQLNAMLRKCRWIKNRNLYLLKPNP